MTDTAASPLFGQVVARTIGEREQIAMREVLTADVPDGIRAHLRASMLRSLQGELDSSAHVGPLLRAPGPAGRILRHTLGVVLPDIVLRRSQYLSLLVEAVRFHESLVVRPRATLVAHLAHAGTAPPTGADLEAKLDAVGEYPYLTQLLRRTLARHPSAARSAEGIRALIDRLDDEVVRRHTPLELARLAGGVFALYERGVAGEPRCPVEPIAAFFDDKHMGLLARSVEQICSMRGLRTLSREELAAILEDLHRAASATDGPAGAPPAAEGTPRTETATSRPEPESPVIHAEESAPEAGRAAPAESEVPPPGPPGPSPGADGPALEAAGPPPHMVPGVETLVDPELRREVIRKLFQRDEAYYESIVLALNRLRTWEETTGYLGSIFEINHLDPRSPVVAAFIDAIQRRFGVGPALESEGGRQ